jgi:lipoyl(octanoyl) transferase
MFEFLDLGKISYESALQIQTEAFETLLKAKSEGRSGKNKLFFCEHDPVYTLGKSGIKSNLLVSESQLKEKGILFYETNRGGDITYHGPGQITGYPVFDLEQLGIGLKQYIELLEETIIRFLALFDVEGKRLNKATGVWLEPETPKARKICAIGVKSSRFVTMHGFALNIQTDLSYFSLINPCGFKDKGVTSLANELNREVNFDEAKKQLCCLFQSLFNFPHEI